MDMYVVAFSGYNMNFGAHDKVRTLPDFLLATLIFHQFEFPCMEIVPGIHQVDGVNGNCYILVRNGLTIIDTGLPGSGGNILAYVRETLHREPSEITTILITHFHTDHVGGVRELKKTAPALKTAIHKTDAGYVSGRTPLPRYNGLKGLLLRIFVTLRPTTFTPDIILKDGDRIEGLTCVHLPGHTLGSSGFLDAESKTFFAGDTLRSDGEFLFEGPTGFTMDVSKSRDAIRKIASLEFDTLLVGHGKPIRPGASAKVREFAETLKVER
jgi:glyoxylase-like metal-dependent hydrolase (beta-lactamase superfamily II)